MASPTLSITLSILGFALVSLAIAGGIRSGSLRRFPLFSTYLGAYWLTGIGGEVLFYLLSQSAYSLWYWSVDLGTDCLEFGIAWEILSYLWREYPGARRAVSAGRAVFCVLFALFIATSCFVMSGWPRHASYVIVLGRDILACQALFLLALLAMVAGYRVSLERRVKGLILGYGLDLALTLAAVAILLYGGNSLWPVIAPLTAAIQICVMATWAVTFWPASPFESRSKIHCISEVAIRHSARKFPFARIFHPIRP